MLPEMIEAMKINHFHSHFRIDAVQTFKIINTSNKRTLEDVLILFRQKYVRPQSQATAKHKWRKLTFDPNRKSLSDFLEELNKYDERAFGALAQQMMPAICQITSRSQKVNQPCLFNERHIRTNSNSPRKRTRIELIENRCRITYSYNGNNNNIKQTNSTTKC